MSSLRLLVLLSLVPFAAGCEQRCCVDEATGETRVTPNNARCPADLTEVGLVDNTRDDLEEQCSALAVSKGFIDESFTCSDFCSRVNEVCDDPACVSSCEEIGDGTPSDASIDCANDATSCQETNACFGEL